MRWVQALNTTGSVQAKPQGGDTRSRRIEAFREMILAAVQAQKDINLDELAELLRTGHGASFAASTVWRFLDRHGMTIEKNRARSRAGGGRRRRAVQGLVQRAA